MHATSRSTGGNRSEKKNTPNAETWQSCDWSIGAAYFFDAFLSLEIAATGTWILWSAAGDEEHERSNSVRYANALQFFGVSHGVRHRVQLLSSRLSCLYLWGTRGAKPAFQPPSKKAPATNALNFVGQGVSLSDHNRLKRASCHQTLPDGDGVGAQVISVVDWHSLERVWKQLAYLDFYPEFFYCKQRFPAPSLTILHGE